jgi:hypothetical protein
MTSPEPAPSKCAGPQGANVRPNPCRVPGELPRCVLCPVSPTYWRNKITTSEGATR